MQILGGHTLSVPSHSQSTDRKSGLGQGIISALSSCLLTCSDWSGHLKPGGEKVLEPHLLKKELSGMNLLVTCVCVNTEQG